MKKMILISENFVLREKLKRFCEKTDFEIVKTFASSDNALSWLEFNAPDFVLVDFYLYGYDGLDFLKSTYEGAFSTILFAPLYQTELFDRAVFYGALGTLTYDFKFSELQSLLNYESKKFTEIVKNENIDDVISNLCTSVGIPANILGYKYIREGIRLTLLDSSYANNVTKELYPSIAKKFNTSASKVERAIRHALEIAVASGKLENLNTLLNSNSYVKGEKMTSSQFIATVTDRLMFVSMTK